MVQEHYLMLTSIRGDHIALKERASYQSIEALSKRILAQVTLVSLITYVQIPLNSTNFY